MEKTNVLAIFFLGFKEQKCLFYLYYAKMEVGRWFLAEIADISIVVKGTLRKFKTLMAQKGNRKDRIFSQKLMDWYLEEKRDLPWRDTRDPYKVWLSEVILQQTRVDQGRPYYEAFVHAYPSINALAKAPEREVLRLWQGLGYYSRARNMHYSARQIVEQHGGLFPNTYKDILKLKGVGPYTAAAIASVCFGEIVPAVDGNVFRFASRVFGIKHDIMKAKTRKIFENRLFRCMVSNHPGVFNQAMMEYGAMICTPSPKCENCIFQSECFAFNHRLQKELPVKVKKRKIKKRVIHYLVFEYNNTFLMKERKEKDVWSGLYDFPVLEGVINEKQVLAHLSGELISFVLQGRSTPMKQLLSHQQITATFYRLRVNKNSMRELKKKLALQAYSFQEVLDLPKPRLIVNYLQQIGIKP